MPSEDVHSDSSQDELKSKQVTVDQALVSGSKDGTPIKKGARFWLIFVGLCIALIMVSLEFVCPFPVSLVLR